MADPRRAPAGGRAGHSAGAGRLPHDCGQCGVVTRAPRAGYFRIRANPAIADPADPRMTCSPGPLNGTRTRRIRSRAREGQTGDPPRRGGAARPGATAHGHRVANHADRPQENGTVTKPLRDASRTTPGSAWRRCVHGAGAILRICADHEILEAADQCATRSARRPTGLRGAGSAAARGKGRPVVGARREDAVRTSATEHRRGRPPQSQSGPPAPRLRAAWRGDACAARGLFSDLRNCANPEVLDPADGRTTRSPSRVGGRRALPVRRRTRGLSVVGRHGRIVPCRKQRLSPTRSIR